MRNLLFIVGLALIFTSCKKHFEDINTDPDQPLTAPPNVILGGVEGTLAYAYGGDLSRHSSIFTQHLTGVSRQWAVLQNYGIVSEDVNTVWGDNLYAGVLMELKQLKAAAEADGWLHYQGVAEVLQAYTLLVVTDNWNAAPYAEAFQGAENLQPVYDSQADIYSTVFTLLASAKTNLNLVDGGPVVPGAEDALFAGDAASWIGFANFIEARAYLHRAKMDAGNYSSALNAIAAGGLTADCGFPFAGGGNANPAFQFNEQRGDCAIGSKLQELINDLNDPRRHLYDHAFDDAHPFMTGDRSVFLGTVTEQKFIEAECTFHEFGAAAAHPLYIEAINLSFGMVGYADSAAAYIAQPEIDPGAGSLTLDHIMTQKYIALFQDPEVFNDWRRTGLPALTPNTGTAIPRRYPYPQEELNLNSNTPSATIFNSVDWD
ncbi:MAG: SusD/RagB family nutrient-binding outer membrane lipoprotein [Crocinitomix sp.]|nr:SusD/RagB family nutrient-binding outer membrane lipoprotein [Crocinitomix sp.]